MSGPWQDWLWKFGAAFVPAFIGTGLLLGVVYVVLMRAIKANRNDVEAWFEHQRLRLQAGPVPVIQRAQPVMLAGLEAIYGRSVWRRLGTSFVVGLFFTFVIFGVVYSEYRQVRTSVLQEKARIEQAADPKLYSYATDPKLIPEYKKAQERILIPTRDSFYTQPVHKGGIFDEIRERQGAYPARLLKHLSANPKRLELTLLFLMEGNVIYPGFQWIHSILLFLFNVLLDFASVTVAVVCLRRLGRQPTFSRGLGMFACALVGTLACFATAFLSYRLFFRGNTGFFAQILIVLPFSLLAALAGLASFLAGLFLLFQKNREQDKLGFLYFLLFGVSSSFGGSVGLLYVWSFGHAASLGNVSWRDLFVYPYVLAATTLVPATLTLIAFALMSIAKMTAEPARIVPEAYMTFVKEEVGGTQAAGIIAIVSLIVSTVIGLIWTVK